MLSYIEYSLNEEERKLWKANEVDFDTLLKLVLILLMVLGTCLGIYSQTEFIGYEVESIYPRRLNLLILIVSFLIQIHNIN